MVKNVKIVIGANFGDEGKGLMTNYFSHQAALRGESCLNVLHNGGAQRGHTVEYPDGRRHVFKHFGSGTFEGAHTYFSEDFILNPIIFRQEWEELERMGVTPKVYVNPKCRVTTPYDMMINQIVEESRGQCKHGSVGLGIMETIVRHCGHFGSFGTRIDDITSISNMIDRLNSIRKIYVRRKMLFERIKKIDEEWTSLIADDRIRDHYLEDLAFMMARIKNTNDNILLNYDTVVFEGGQGLMLDQNNEEYFPHLTPSNTGLQNPMKILRNAGIVGGCCSLNPITIEACYVTRTYLTRHGAGWLENECDKEDISPFIQDDQTNVSNPNQGSLRYAPLDVDDMLKRCIADQRKHEGYNHILSTIAVTHMNENNIELVLKPTYESHTPYSVIENHRSE